MSITSLFPRARAVEPGDRQPHDPAEAAAAVRALNQQYVAAVAGNDAEWFQQHMAEDAVVVLGSGRRLGKAEFLAMLSDEPKRYRSLTARDVTFRMFGSIVQVDADAAWEMADGSAGVSRYIDTWAWLEGRWQVISAQITLLPPPAARE